ncbi:hypothetical protein [Streptomyces sp. NPDC002057]|uniref:hypothetical protein n=1 Tax=Streptomyces sp. NPDC002057 TaxID=3154664 RepID=UPI00331BD057
MEHEALGEARAWILGAIGEPLLNYLLPEGATSEEGGTAGPIEGEFFSAVAELRRKLPEDWDEQTQKQAFRSWLLQKGEGDKTVARIVHERTCVDDVESGDDAVTAALIEVAQNVYPALLIPAEPLPFPALIQPEVDTAFHAAAYQNGGVFTRAIARDSGLSSVFTQDSDPIHSQFNYQANTGHGGALQLATLPSELLLSAWRDVRETMGPVGKFIERVMFRWDMLRSALLGNSVDAVAKIAFTGVLLPDGRAVAFGDGVVRTVTQAERDRVPEGLKGKISGYSGDGEVVTINYDGDVLLEYRFPYRLRLSGDLSESWVDSDEMRPPADINRLALRLRFALMLSMDSTPRAQLIQTWVAFDEPPRPGSSISWSDPRHGAGFTPVRLTSEDVDRWCEWFDILNDSRVDKIELALSRILRALAERRDPSDVLVDSVIAWENLFGTKDGEPTFRITMCLTKLLKEGLEERVKFRTELGKIYALRSRVVHGSGELKATDMVKCQEALDVAISAIRVLVSRRQDILDLKDGALRSAALLLDG